MATAKYYSPRLERDLIAPLYLAAKSRRIPMTHLASTLIREGLGRLAGGENEGSAIIREDPRSPDPRGQAP